MKKSVYSVYQYGKEVEGFSSKAEASKLAKRLARADGYKTLKPAAVKIVKRSFDRYGGLKGNPPRVHRKKTMTIRNAASVTIKQLPDGRALVKVKR